MKESITYRNFAVFLLVVSIALTAFASYHAFDFGNITGAFSVGDNVSDNSSYDFVFEENITEPDVPDNISIPDVPDNITIPDNVSGNLTDNISIPVNITKPENVSNKTFFSIPEVNVSEPIIEEVAKKVVSVKKVSLSDAVDYYCEDISMFLKRCILQTEKELCHLEGKEIVCSGVLNTESYETELSPKDAITFAEKGIPVNIDSKLSYFKPNEGTRFVVDWNSEKYIHIGFTSDTFVIQDFYYGTCGLGDNCTIDVGVEISPTDNEITLPQSADLVGRWDFVTNADDTGVLRKNNGTVSGATHTYERYDFDGDSGDSIQIDNANSLNITNNFTISVWFKRGVFVGNFAGVIGNNFVGGYWMEVRKSSSKVEVFINGTAPADIAISNIVVPLDEWIHVVLVWDDDKKNASFYANGEYNSYDVPTKRLDAGGGGTTIYIGEDGRDGIQYPWNGSIENMYVWNTTLNANEIELLYNETRFNTSHATTYTSKFTGGVVQVNQSKTNWQNLVWDSTEPADTNIELRYRVGNYSKIYETDSDLVSYWKLNRSDGTNAFADSNPDNNQVLHMKFNSATDFTDYSGQGNDGTNSGSAYTNLGYIGGARSFDGSNDYVQVAYNESTQFSATQSFAVCAWIKAESGEVSNGAYLFDNRQAAYNEGYYLRIESANSEAYFGIEDTGGTNAEVRSLVSLNDNQWYQICGVRDVPTDKLYIYFDGDEKNNNVDTTTQTLVHTDPITIGKGGGGVAVSEVFDGLIDNVRIYNTSLNSTQVKELYSKEAGTFDEINDNHGIVNGSVSRTGGVFESDGALHFDADASPIQFVNVTDAASLISPYNSTVVIWVKADSLTATTRFFDADSNLRTYMDGGVNSFIFYKGHPASTYSYAGVVPNRWYQVALSWQKINDTTGEVMNSYVDGVLRDSKNFTNIQQATIAYIGTDRAFSVPFNGTIDSVAIYNRTLSSSEISDLYTSWSGWSEYDDASPTALSGRGFVLQYEARLNTTNNSITPVLNEVNITYEALPGSVDLVYPVNDTILNGRNIDFRCTATINNPDINFKNITLFIWNSTDDSLVYSNTQLASGSNANQNWTYILPHSGSYEYNCEAISDTDSGNFSESNYTFNITFRTTVDNVTTDVNTELKPFDSLENLPQINNLIARWDFVEDADDSSGQDNNGTVSGATHTFERYDFDGDDDIVTIPDDPSLELMPELTISAWFKPNLLQSKRLFDKSWNTYSLNLWSTGNIKIHLWTNVTSASITSSNVVYSANNWYHGVITYNGSYVKLFVNGIEEPLNLPNLNGSIKNSGVFRIGTFEGTSQFFNGSIENVYIWNTSLSDEEVMELYRATRFNTEGNTVDYIGRYTNAVDSGNDASVWTNLTWSETEPTGTTIDLRYRLGNYTPVDLTDNDLVSYWKLNRSDGTNAFANSNPDSYQVLHMKFNNKTDFTDYSGKGNDGTNTGSAYTNLGYIGGARSFDGSNDYVNLGNPASMNSLSQYTIATWIKLADSTGGRLLSKGANENAFMITSTLLTAIAYNGTVSTGVKNCGITNPLNTWIYVTLVNNGTAFLFYHNGNHACTSAFSARGQFGGGGAWNIGSYLAGSQFVNGPIDNVRIYNTSLNATQVKELYAKEAGTYDEQNRNLGTAYNNVDRIAGIFENDLALEFDGVDDYVDVSLVSGLNTNVSWVKLPGGQWTFLVVTRTMNYTNGVAGGGAQIPFNGTHIGVYLNDTLFSGTIDSLAVYNSNLTANEISDLYINWSGWSTYYSSGPVDIGNYTARAIQYQALLNTSNDSVTPVFGGFETTDSTPPIINLLYPLNDTILNGRNVDFRCTATSNANIKNITLYIWDSGGSLVYSDTPTITQALSVSQNWTYILPSDGTYYYNCKAFNVNDLVFSFAAKNNTFDVTFKSAIDNVTTDVDTELKPFDSLENLPALNNLVGRWDFVTNADDSSGQDNNGTVHGATHTFERYEFDGTDDYIDCGSTGIVSDWTEMTICAWAKKTAYNQHQGLVSDYGNTAPRQKFVFGHENPEGTLNFVISDGVGGDSHSITGFTQDEWHLVCGVFIGSTSLALYLDDTNTSKTTAITDIDPGASYIGFDIGRYAYTAASTYEFEGDIGNVWLWNTSLSAEEITELYRASRFNTEGNTVDYVGRYTNAIDSGNANTQWRNLTWLETEPTGTNIKLRYRLGNYTPVDTTDSDLVSYWKLNRSDGTNAFANSNPDSYQVLHMKFNNKTDFYDYSGQGNTGTNVGSAYTNLGYIGGARSFDGTNDYVLVNQMNISNSTVSMWIKNNTSWHHLVNATGTEYLDASAKSISMPFNGSHIGIYPDGTYFNGLVDNVRVYNDSKLTATQVKELYSKEAGTYDETGNNLGTAMNDVDRTAGIFENDLALEFDGSDYVTIGDSASLNFSGHPNMTMVAWIKPNTLSGLDGILDNSENTSSPKLSWLLSGDRQWFSIGDGANYDSLLSAHDLILNQWQFIAFTLNDTEHKFYYNDNQTGSTQNIVKNLAASTIGFTIGRAFQSGTYSFDGSIDSLTIYNRTLTANEISDLYINWSGWSAYQAASPINLNKQIARAVQYQAKLNTSNDSVTPVLGETTENYGIYCGDKISKNTILTNDLSCNGTALYLVADNIVLSCAGHYISGDGAGLVGIKINSSNVNITDCYIDDFEKNIYADPGVNIIIENNTLQNSSNCTILEKYNSSIIRNNTYHNCTDNAILLINESNHNQIYNNTINMSWVGVNIKNGTNNTVWDNNFTNSLHAHANSISGNNFNRTKGNYWDDILSLKIFDTDADGLGDAGSQYPYNNTNNANVTGLVNDYRPFTTKTPGPFTVNITLPLNNTILNTSDINISCTINSSDNINNLTMIIWNADNTINQTNSTNPGLPNVTQIWNVFLLTGNYTAACNATNVLNQRNKSLNNSFIIDTIVPAIKFIPPTTAAHCHIQNWIAANVTVNDTTLDTITINLYNSSKNLINTTSNSTSSIFFFNFTGLADGTYYLNSTANDSVALTNSTETRRIMLDTTAPAVILIIPPNGSQTQSPVLFTFQVTDTTYANCSLNINGNPVANQTNLSSGTHVFNQSLALGEYKWNVSCTDCVGLFNDTKPWNVTVIPPPPPSRGGGKAGGARASFSMDVPKLCVNEKAKITINPKSSGQLIVSHFDKGKWFYLSTLKVQSGTAYFTPTKAGMYRFDFKIFNSVAATKTATAKICSREESPLDFADNLMSKIADKVQEEIKFEKPEKVKEEAESFEEKTEKYRKASKENKAKYIIPAIPALITLILVSMNILKRGKTKKRKKR